MKRSDDVVEVLVLVPRAALSSSTNVDFYSQQNCELLGLTKRQYLELLRREDAPVATATGKLRLVRREAMMAFLDRLAPRTDERAEAAQLDGPDRVLLDLGCRPSRRTGR